MKMIDQPYRTREASPLKGLLAGAVGGLAGSLAMVAFQAASARLLGSPTRPAEEDVAGDGAPDSDGPSTVMAARKIARGVTGGEIPAEHERAAGRAFHFAFGLGLGGAYGALAEVAPGVSVGSGLAFGALQTLLADELVVPAMGLSGSPHRAPAHHHAKALAARLVYSVVLDRVRRGVRARI